MFQLMYFRIVKNPLKIILSLQELSDKKKENLLTAIYIGGFFIILAIIYSINPGLWGNLVSFFSSLTLAPVPASGISLPAPASPASNMSLYLAAFQFALALGILEIVILFLRVGLHSSVTRKAETVENIVFWLGSSYLIVTYLVNMTISSEWFVFWAGIILIFGLALVARSFVLLAKQ
jgi:hypothetical protein